MRFPSYLWVQPTRDLKFLLRVRYPHADIFLESCGQTQPTTLQVTCSRRIYLMYITPQTKFPSPPLLVLLRDPYGILSKIICYDSGDFRYMSDRILTMQPFLRVSITEPL